MSVTLAPPRANDRERHDAEVLRALADRVDPGDAGAQNNLGVFYHQKGLYEDAIAAFERALALDPRMELARRNLATVSDRAGHYTRVVAELREMTRRGEADGATRLRLATALLRSGRPEEAERELRALHRLSPRDVPTLSALADASHAAGDAVSAVGWLRRAIAVAPDSAVLHFQLGELLYNSGDSDGARVALERATELNPGFAEAYHVLAFVLGDLGQPGEAAGARHRAVELNPALAHVRANLSLGGDAGAVATVPVRAAGAHLVHYHLAMAFRRKGMFEEALLELEHAERGGEEPDMVRAARAELFLARGDAARALELYGEITPTSLDAPRLWSERGVCHHVLGQLDEAEAFYRRALEADPEYSLAWNNLGVARAYLSDSVGAAHAFGRAIATRAELATARCNLGLMLSREGKGEESLRAYQDAISLDAECAPAWCGVGILMRQARRFPDARTALVRAVELDPESAEARYALSFVLAQLGEFDSALRETKRALALNPYFSNPRFRLAIELQYEEKEVIAPDFDAEARVGAHPVQDFRFDEDGFAVAFAGLTADVGEPASPALDRLTLARDYLNRGMLDRALIEVRRAVTAEPFERALLMASILARLGLHGEALDRYDDALAALPNGEWCEQRRQALIGRARMLERLDTPAEARIALAEVIAAAPDDQEALSAMARVRLLLADATGAAAVAERLLELAPGSADGLRLLGRARAAEGRREEAMRLLVEAVAAAPAGVEARLDLARHCLEDRMIDDAAEACRGVLDVLPTHPEAVLLLVDVLCAGARHAETIEPLVDFLSLDPYHPPALVRLGRVLLDVGRPDDAERAIARALRFDPGHPEAIFLLGAAHEAAGRPEDADRCWARCCALPDPGAWAERARSAVREAGRMLDVADAAPLSA